MKDKVLLVLAFGALLHVIYVDSLIDRDAGFFMVVGQGIAEGGVLYRDFFDFKPPGMHYTSALVYLLVRDSLLGFKVAVLMVNLASAYILYELARILWDGKSALAASFMYLLGLPLFNGLSFLSEQFVVLFSGLGLLCYLQHLKSGGIRHLLASGVLLGVSFLYKQVGLLVLAAVFCHYVLTSRRIGYAVSFAFFSVIPFIVFMAYFASLGLLGEALNSMLSIVGRYGSSPLSEIIEYSYGNFILYPILWILSFSSVLSLLRRKDLASDESVIHASFLISVVPTFFQQFPHYYVPALFFGCMLAGKAILDIWKASSKLKDREAGTVITILILLMFTPTIFKLAVEYHYITKYRMLGKFMEASEYVKDNTLAGEKVLVVPNEPLIYFISRRDSPTKYLHLDYSSYYPGIEERIIGEAEGESVRFFVVRESVYLDEYAGVIHDYILGNCVLVKSVDDKYPIKVYRRVK
ncbi:MAG: glycosyltransferase family 39 protein [Candidatus Altiarchaeota archaeon]